MKVYYLLLFISFISEAAIVQVQNFFLNCKEIGPCPNLEARFENMQVNYSSQEKLMEILEEVKKSLSEYEISYRVALSGGIAKVYVTFTPLTRIGEFSIEVKNNINLSKFSMPRKGDRFSEKDIEALRDDLKELLKIKGYKRPKIKVEKTLKDYRFFIHISVDAGSLKKIKRVEVIAEKDSLELIIPRFENFKNELWDKSSFDIKLEDIVTSYQNEGYYLFTLKVIKIKEELANLVIPVVSVNFGPRLGFDIKGNKTLSRLEIVNKLKEMFNSHGKEVSKLQIRRWIQELYFEKSVYHSKVLITDRIIFLGRRELRNYFINIQEGHRYSIERISFDGVKEFTEGELRDYFKSQGNRLIRRGYLDENYTKDFVEDLKKYYLKKGFIFVKIIGPKIRKDMENKLAKIFYHIVEGRQVYWKRFDLVGVPDDVKNLVIKGIKNGEEAPVNLVDLRSDIQKIENNLREQGYFFVKILNKNSTNVIQYSKDYSSATLNLRIYLGKIVRFNDVVIVGLKHTHRKVIEREVFLNKSEKITPSKIQKLRARILKLGLFRSISLSPFFDDNSKEEANILISVVERKFGFLEFAPGFRSDVGLKFSTAVGYNNLFGQNHSIIFKSQVNQRLDFSSFDERRRQNKKKNLEYKVSLSYDWPYFIFLPIEMSTIFSFFKKKFRSFDADITRGSFTLSRVWADWFSTTIRYRIENNKQFDTTDSDDAGNFSVGSLMPGLTLDFRNHSIHPSSGAIFNLSAELTRPYLGSQDGNKDISYNKIISRNAFYFPLERNMVLAFSFMMGVQKNLSREIPIPSIKVFRLSGIDRVRGFSSNEINRLDLEGRDFPNIDNIDVLDKIYFVNFKLEPRYNFSDTFVLAPFVDAGRIMLDTYRPLDLRGSVGLSLKFVTPVGILNFDYGIKMKRNRFRDGTREVKDDFGRFHLTLGFF